jgi:hypothetical protein
VAAKGAIQWVAEIDLSYVGFFANRHLVSPCCLGWYVEKPGFCLGNPVSGLRVELDLQAILGVIGITHREGTVLLAREALQQNRDVLD